MGCVEDSIKIKKMTHQELKNGQSFHFDNEEWCEENLSDDVRGGWIEWNNRFNWFSITLTGLAFMYRKLSTQLKKGLKN